MIFIRLFSYLPFWFIYLFSDVLSFVAFRIIRYRKKVVFENLQRSFPERSSTEILSIAKEFYKNLSDIIVETAKELTISKKEIVKRVSFRNTEELEEYFRNRQSVLLVTIHQGNWEWLLLAGCIRFNIPVDAVYMPLSNKNFEKLMFNARSRFGGNPIHIDDTIKEIARRSKVTRAFALLADQVPAKNASKYWTTFLNQETPFLLGPEQLARFTKYPVFYIKMNRRKRGYYEVNIEKIASPPYSKEGNPILKQFVERSEQAIVESPSEWLWSHRRWKYKKPLYDK